MARNCEALDLARSLGEGPASLGIDYRKEDSWPAKMLPQFALARMLYVQAILAREDGHPGEAAAVVAALGRQAAILEGEPPILVQTTGIYAEKLQALLLLAGAAPDGSAPLVANDLRQRYREAIAYEATQSRDLFRQARVGSGEFKPDKPTGAGDAPFLFLAHRTAEHAAAGALDRYRLYLRGFDEGYPWIREHLDDDPKRLGFYQRIRRIGDPHIANLTAGYRAMAASRELTRTCLRLRTSWRDGVGCEKLVPQVSSPVLRVAAQGDGGCRITIRTADGFDYLRLYPPNTPPAAPQECTLPRE